METIWSAVVPYSSTPGVKTSVSGRTSSVAEVDGGRSLSAVENCHWLRSTKTVEIASAKRRAAIQRGCRAVFSTP